MSFESDKARAFELIARKDELTQLERVELVQILQVRYHDSEKIEGAFSIDSSAHGCTFCAKMRAAAKKDPSIICGYCYDYAQEKYRITVLNRHDLNRFILASVSFTIDELKLLPGGYITRENSSGDIENQTHAENLIKYAYAHPQSNVALYAKNVIDADNAIDILGMPDNLKYVESSIYINKAGKRSRYAHVLFVVYDKDHIKDAIAAGACVCNGQKCKSCNDSGFKCYYRDERGWKDGSIIAELLRGNKPVDD